jgi:hypothetical protein
MMLLGSGEPHPVVCRRFTLVAEDEDNLVFDIDRKAAEHWPGSRREQRNRVEHEFMRNGFTLFDGEESVVQR